MKPSHGTRYLQTHMIVCQPRTFLIWFQELIAEFGRSKPLAFLLLALKHSILKEKMFLIGRTYYTELAIPFHKLSRPAE